LDCWAIRATARRRPTRLSPKPAAPGVHGLPSEAQGQPAAGVPGGLGRAPASRPREPGRKSSERASRQTRVFMGWNYARYVDQVTEGGQARVPHSDVRERLAQWAGGQRAGRLPQRRPTGSHARYLARRAPRTWICFVRTSTCRTSPNWRRDTARSGQPLYVPESAGDIHGAANAFYAIGQYKAIGYSSMGIGNWQRLTAFRASDAGPQVPTDVENLPLPAAYATLAQLAPLVLEHQAKSTIARRVAQQGQSGTEIQAGRLHAKGVPCGAGDAGVWPIFRSARTPPH